MNLIFVFLCVSDGSRKGNVQTHWVRMACAPISDISEASSQNDGGSSAPSQRRMSGPGKNAVSTKIWEGTGLEAYLGKTELDPRIDRLVDWNVELLAGMLKSVVAQRIAKGAEATQIESGIEEEVAGDLVLDEVRMVIEFPDFDAKAAARAAEVLGDIELPLEVKSELRQYVAAIASGYWDNPFHDFEHASHVILSANKLLKRIQSLDDDKFGDVLTSYDVHEHTYGIGTDPLTQFTLAFAALVHDVGHTGVPNTQLSQDDPDLAEKYVFKSIAEQHSVDLAWDLLMLPAFKNLRSCIYQDRGDCERFRSLLVNSGTL